MSFIGSAAFWTSLLLVAYWAYWNFHAPRPPVALRIAVTLHRYLLSLTLYIFAAICVFLLTLLCILALEGLARWLGTPLPESLVGPSLFAALLATVLLPRAPVSRTLHGHIRQRLQSLALFPDDLQRLVGRLARQTAPLDQAAKAALRREVARYGLEVDTMERCLPAAVITRLHEAQSLHDRFTKALATEELATFGRAAAEQIAMGSAAHARLLRRVARSLLLAEAIRSVRERAGPPPKELVRIEDFSILDQFIADEAVTVALLYRELIAQAALSRFARPTARNAFLLQMGFTENVSEDLPFAAILCILGVVPASCLVFLAALTLQWGLKSLLGVPSLSVGLQQLLLSPLFGLLQFIVVLCAVLPKVLIPSARPNGQKLPLRWDCGMALVAYASNLAFFALLVAVVKPPTPPGASRPPDMFVFAPVVSLFAPALALALALRIDGKLRDPEFRFGRGRVLDAIVLGGVLGATDVLVQLLLLQLSRDGTWHFRPALTIQLAAVGAMIGYLVPYVVAAYLNRRASEIAAARQEMIDAQAGNAVARDVSAISLPSIAAEPRPPASSARSVVARSNS